MLLINKKIGETPLECIGRIKATKGRLARLPMTYAGRLDPMAEGLLIILVGEECKDEEKQKFLALNKVYEFEVLFGVATDTHDVLGLITDFDISSDSFKNLADSFSSDQSTVAISKITKDFLGKRMQKYPHYSSKTVDGRPLFEITRSGELEGIDTEDFPHKEVEIFNIDLLGLYKEKIKNIVGNIKSKINMVNGDFRQDLIIDKWNGLSEGTVGREDGADLLIAKFRARVSSGTYIRVLANEIGKKLGIPALAYSIKRVQVGEYKLNDITTE